MTGARGSGRTRSREGRGSRSGGLGAWRGAVVGALSMLLLGGGAHAESVRTADAHRAILELNLTTARELLRDGEEADPSWLLERARLAIYEGNYDGAVAILARPELARTDEGAELAAIAGGCARATAGAITISDETNGLFLRLQDDEDRALVPWLVRAAGLARDSLVRDLRVELPRPLHIEVVRDLFTLAAMTGLPESAAQTTGTVAVAKWGRVTLLSPRAVPHGYPWADTLAHELAHLAQTQASADRAPLWLQEGVAKRQETRWRDERPLDDFPGADAIAAVGLDRGLGRPIDKLGASIAMLPSPEHAMVAFAEVSSFVRFFVQQTGDQALPELLSRLHDAPADGSVDSAMKAVTGASLAQWNARWLQYLATVKRDLPPDAGLGGRAPHEADLRRNVALSELLRARGHHQAAATLLRPAQKSAPFDPLLRHHLASALYALGRLDEADALIAREADVHSEYGPWVALHAAHLERSGDREGAARARTKAVELCPLDEEVACQGKMLPELPSTEESANLCRAARATATPESANLCQAGRAAAGP